MALIIPPIAKARVIRMRRQRIHADGLWLIPPDADTSGVSLLQDDVGRICLVRTDLDGVAQAYDLFGADGKRLRVKTLSPKVVGRRPPRPGSSRRRR